MSTHAQKVGWAALLKPAWFPALAVLVGGVLLHSMNVLMLATVLPSIVEDVGGATLMSLPNTGFLASSIIAACCTGYMNAVIGARRAFAAGALLFGIGALLCALAPSMVQVVAGRFVQGFGGGLLSAMAYVLVRATFPEIVWTRAITLLSGAWSLSILVGPLLGGVFATYGHWRGSFYAVTALAVLLAVLALRALPRTLTGHGERPRVPGLRVALISAAILAMSVAAASPVLSVKAVLVVAAIAGLVLMLRLDRRAPTPLLPSDAFSPRTMTGIGLWLVLLISAAFSPLQIYVPTFLQVLHGLDPLVAGYMVAGGSLGWTGASLIVAGATPRWVGRLLVLGPLSMAVGLFGLSGVLPLKPFALSIGPIILLGIGIGSTWAFTAQRVMSGARKGEETVAASSVATVQQAGGALGAALAGLIANLAGLSGGLTVADVTAAAFWVPGCFVGVALAATAAGILLRRAEGP